MTDIVYAALLGAVLVMLGGALEDFGERRDLPRPVVTAAWIAVLVAGVIAVDTVSDRPLFALLGVALVVAASWVADRRAAHT
jgi:hypothetical protein